jgi:hypothetical protein
MVVVRYPAHDGLQAGTSGAQFRQPIASKVPTLPELRTACSGSLGVVSIKSTPFRSQIR